MTIKNLREVSSQRKSPDSKFWRNCKIWCDRWLSYISYLRYFHKVALFVLHWVAKFLRVLEIFPSSHYCTKILFSFQFSFVHSIYGIVGHSQGFKTEWIIWKHSRVLRKPFKALWNVFFLNTIHSHPIHYIWSNSILSRCIMGNKLSGSIPRTLGKLSNLQYMLFIPHFIKNLEFPIYNLPFSLSRVLSNNNLSGTIPESFGNLSNLRALFASHFLFVSLHYLIENDTIAIIAEYWTPTNFQELSLSFYGTCLNSKICFAISFSFKSQIFIRLSLSES